MNFIKKFFAYLSESQSEMKKVTWPSRKDSIRLSVAVIVFIILFASLIGIFDSIMARLIERII